MSLLLSLSLLVSGVQTPPQLHATGILHVDDIQTTDGANWLALVPDGHGWTLLPSRITVTPLDATAAPGSEDGERREVRAVEAEDATLLLRGDGFLPGPTLVAEFDAGWGWTQGPLGLEFLGERTQLAMECAAEPGAGCTLWLGQGKARQALLRYEALMDESGQLQPGDDIPLALLFAGDLDGDGKIDLIIDASPKYSMSIPTLFLSGAAGRGEIVRAVAAQRRVGC
jgi:hypothetical protein